MSSVIRRGDRPFNARLFFVIVVATYPAWLAMMALHEVGHALHAVTSGGRVTGVTLPLIGFSRTDVAPNPHPQWTAWGGPLWGCLLPMIALGIARRFRRPRNPARVFAGFCMIANGAYLGLGPWMTAGDGHDLIRHGAPRWTLMLFGAIATAGGLYLWHLATQTTRPAAAAPTAAP
jgi:hypothetical protein